MLSRNKKKLQPGFEYSACLWKLNFHILNVLRLDISVLGSHRNRHINSSYHYYNNKWNISKHATLYGEYNITS